MKIIPKFYQCHYKHKESNVSSFDQIQTRMVQVEDG